MVIWRECGEGVCTRKAKEVLLSLLVGGCPTKRYDSPLWFECVLRKRLYVCKDYMCTSLVARVFMKL